MGSAAVVGLFAALQFETATRAFHASPEAFLGILLAAPLLSGLFAAFGVIVLDLSRSPAERHKLLEGFDKDPRQWMLSAAKVTGQASFLGAILLSLFGQGWLLSTWFFGAAAVSAAVLTFFF